MCEEALQMTTGKKLVGINFNVGCRADIQQCKERFADAIDQLESAKNDLYIGDYDPEVKAIFNEALVRIIDAQMWAVKALTMVD